MRPVTGIVLAGGQGRRLGMGPKHSVPVGEQTMLDRVADWFAPQVSALRINGPRDAATVRHDPPPVGDGRYAGQGPLAGLLAAMRQVDADWIAGVPVDAVCGPRDLVARLQGAVGKADSAYVAGQPCCLLVRTAAADSIETRLMLGRRSVIDWLESLGAVPVDFADRPDAVWSINTPNELALAEQRLMPHEPSA